MSTGVPHNYAKGFFQSLEIYTLHFILDIAKVSDLVILGKSSILHIFGCSLDCLGVHLFNEH